MKAPPEYEAPHVAAPKCPVCSDALMVPVFHPVDRPCTIELLRVPT